jgi:cytochrome c oxidase cbb3-type subunit 4
MDYEQFRHFADSWGLIYLFAVFVIMVLFIWRPGSGAQYRHAARIAVDASEDRPTPPKTETEE